MAGRDARSATTDVRTAGSTRAGPLAGWTWRDARGAIQFGKRQGAYGVELRPGNVRFFLDAARPGAASARAVARPARKAGPVAPTRRRDAATLGDSAAPPAALSKRKQRSAQRLQEFQQHKRTKLLWWRALAKVLKMCRHHRMWDVHNAWYATRSASADAAGPPAPDTERMDVGSSTMAKRKRAAEPAEQQPGARVEGGLRATAEEFAPGLPMAEVQRAWRGAVKLAAGRWQVSWHDLANVLTEQSAAVLEKQPWHPWPGQQAPEHHARSSSRASSHCETDSELWHSD